MASGFSNRMKQDKLLLKIGGKTLIERVIDSCVHSKLSDIILVYRKDEIRDLALNSKVRVIKNENAYKGQSESIKLGVKNVRSDSKGIMFIVGDQPFLDAITINELITEFESDNEKIIIPVYNGNKGNPTVFPSSFKDEFFSLEGDIGGKYVISKNLEKVKYIDIENYIAGVDMDTKEEYEKMKGED